MMTTSKEDYYKLYKSSVRYCRRDLYDYIERLDTIEKVEYAYAKINQARDIATAKISEAQKRKVFGCLSYPSYTTINDYTRNREEFAQACAALMFKKRWLLAEE